MGRINMGRVIVGGFLAGLIINISEFVLNGVVSNWHIREWDEVLVLPDRP